MLHVSGLSKPFPSSLAANARGLSSSEKPGSVRLNARAAAPPCASSTVFWKSSALIVSCGSASISAAGPIAVSGAGPPRAIVLSPSRVTESTATSMPPGVCGPTPAARTVPGWTSACGSSTTTSRTPFGSPVTVSIADGSATRVVLCTCCVKRTPTQPLTPLRSFARVRP